MLFFLQLHALITICLTKKICNMKTYTIIYVPFGREDKEWIDVQANSKEEAMNNFKGGMIIQVRE